MGERRRFELVRELGSGTFGTVFLADMVSLGGFRKRVALKMLNPQWEEGSDAGRRLRDEARLLGRLRHRHIVSVDDLVRLNGSWTVVMEYVPGVDLERLIRGANTKSTAIPMAPSLDIIAAVAEALRVAYDGGLDGETLQVIHRDIKPSNILLTPEGDVKVLDFGIASASFQGREAKTDRVRFGSIPYMSPERVLGEPEIPAGDVYALGCVLYELLLGRRLGRAELGPARQEAQVSEALQVLQNELESTPQELLRLIEDCLEYDVENRPSAGDVASRARALGRTLSGDGLHAFAREFVPAVLEKTPQPAAHGIYSEELVPPDEQRGSHPTLVLPNALSTAPSDGATTPPTSPRENGVLQYLIVGVGLAMLASVLLFGLGMFWYQTRSPTTTTTTTPVNTPVTAPPATPQFEQPPEEALPPAEPVAAEPVAAEPVAATPQPVAAAEEHSAAEASRIRSVKFTAPAGATAISAQCGDVFSEGTGSVNLRNIPAGSCSVTTTVDGSSTSTTLTVARPTGFTCALDGGALTCR
ncbi:MAG: serine/threonine-protein kinase [Myxococcota bacterium]|nr:serine/threonine-protein kinase [Myxococcota bacterium]